MLLWKFVDCFLDRTNDRLIIQADMHSGHLINLHVERASKTSDVVPWRSLLFKHWHKGYSSLNEAFMTMVDMVLINCSQHYERSLPEFGNTVFIVDSDEYPVPIEKIDPLLENVLKTPYDLFNGLSNLPPTISRSELTSTAARGGFFLPQTQLVSYQDQFYVAKGIASAQGVEDNSREVTNLLSLPSRHAHIIPGPTALVQLSATDPRLCGFLTPLYENSNLDHQARNLRESATFRDWKKILWEWFHQLVSAAKFLNDAGIWHGDIKPDNILVSRDNDLVLIDFTRKYTTMTIAAPELRSEINRVNKAEIPTTWPLSKIEKCEVYSIGRTMFFVCEGIAMMDIYTRVRQDGNVTEFSNRLETPLRMRTLVEACVRSNPVDRPTLNELMSYLAHPKMLVR